MRDELVDEAAVILRIHRVTDDPLRRHDRQIGHLLAQLGRACAICCSMCFCACATISSDALTRLLLDIRAQMFARLRRREPASAGPPAAPVRASPATRFSASASSPPRRLGVFDARPGSRERARQAIW